MANYDNQGPHSNANPWEAFFQRQEAGFGDFNGTPPGGDFMQNMFQSFGNMFQAFTQPNQSQGGMSFSPNQYAEFFKGFTQQGAMPFTPDKLAEFLQSFYPKGNMPFSPDQLMNFFKGFSGPNNMPFTPDRLMDFFKSFYPQGGMPFTPDQFMNFFNSMNLPGNMPFSPDKLMDFVKSLYPQGGMPFTPDQFMNFFKGMNLPDNMPFSPDKLMDFFKSFYPQGGMPFSPDQFMDSFNRFKQSTAENPQYDDGFGSDDNFGPGNERYQSTGENSEKDDTKDPWMDFWKNTMQNSTSMIGQEPFNFPGGYFIQLYLQNQVIPELMMELMENGVPLKKSEKQQGNPIVLKASGDKSPLFCIHGLAGSIDRYTTLSKLMHEDVPCYAIEAPETIKGDQPETIEEIAAIYLKEIQTVQPEGPYRIVGFSFGAWVSFEIAKQLTASGEQVEFLGLMGAGIPPALNNPILSGQMDYLNGLMKDFREIMLEPFMTPEQRLAMNSKSPGSDKIPAVYRLIQRHIRMIFSYRPRAYKGKITLFETAEQQNPFSFNCSKGWTMLGVEDIETQEVPGNFFNLLTDPHVNQLAEKLNQSLEQL